jgi:hypothetical protein
MHVRRRSPENQPGAESPMGEAEGSHTKARNLSPRPQENRSRAESEMGEVQGEEGKLIVGSSAKALHQSCGAFFVLGDDLLRRESR